MTPSVGLVAEHLRCEYLIDPLAIDEARPRLSWTLGAARRGARQTAYQIIVSGDQERLLAGTGDLWDSGKVEDDRSAHVIYQGAALASGRRCWWAVRVWDERGEVSAWSAPARWEMGLLRPEEWHGSWIGLAEHQPVPDPDLPPSPFLRTTFRLDRPVRQARLYATARGLYELRLNGERVGDQVLAPGWTDYRVRIQYQTYDVGALLREGENALGAILGTGWYAGHVGWPHQEDGQTRHYGERPAVLVELRISHTDGTTTLIASDGTWRGAYGSILSSDLLMGETYDARAELPGWDQPGYDDRAWQGVWMTPRDETLLVADRAEPVRVVEDLTPTAITPRPDGSWIVDLGQNIAGWVRLRVRGESGTRVQLRFAEVLNPDGSLYTANLRSARQTDTYILKGDGEEVYEPRFTFHGFRFVEVSGFPGELTAAAITGRAVESATRESGTFTCSNALVSQLYRNIVWGQRGNFLSIPTDCPQRDERLGWLADAQIFAPAACFNRDVAAFYTKWLTDVTDAQSLEGAFSDVAPRLVDLADGAPAWGDGGVILPWTLYERYADTRLLERHFDAMRRWVAWIEARNPDLLWRNGRNNDFGDWLNVNAETPKEVIGTAYFARDAWLLARMARALGREDDAATYETLFAAIKRAFVAAYVDDDGRVLGETQTCYVLALAFELLPDDLRPRAAAHLLADVARHNWHLTTGFVGLGLLFPVLTAIGATDVAYRLLLNETYPSWGYMIRHGATTIWERWDGWTEERGFQNPGMNSFNHYAFGAVGDWLFRAVAGIDTDPAYPGFRRLVIHPRPGGGLTHAAATYDSLHGQVESAWRIEGETFALDLAIPANTTATVTLPAADPARITEGGRPVAEAEGVTPLAAGAGEATFHVVSGRYAFASHLPRAATAAGGV